jgi:hypothetical protein
MAVLFTHYDSDEADSVTNATSTFAEKLSTTFTAVGGINYVIQFYCEVTMSTNSSFAEIKMELDNTTTLCLVADRNTFYTNPWCPVGSIWRGTLTAGTRQIDLDFRNFDNATTIGIRRARIMILEETT